MNSARLLTGIETGVIELTTSTECVRETVLMYTDPPPRETATEQVPEFPPLIKPLLSIEQAPLCPIAK